MSAETIDQNTLRFLTTWQQVTLIDLCKNERLASKIWNSCTPKTDGILHMIRGTDGGTDAIRVVKKPDGIKIEIRSMANEGVFEWLEAFTIKNPPIGKV